MKLNMSEIIALSVAEKNPEALFADGFERALLGYVEINHKALAVYDREKCIDILTTRDGMDRDDAEEFFEVNVLGSYVGENTPAFITIL
jgi:hypothetical protein